MTVNEYIFWLVHISQFLCILLKSKGISPKPGIYFLILTILAKSWWSYTHFNPDTDGKSETLEKSVLTSVFCIWKFGSLVRKKRSQNLDVSLASGANPSLLKPVGSFRHSGSASKSPAGPWEHLESGWTKKSWHQENDFLTSLICSEIGFVFSHSWYLPCRQDLQLTVSWKLLWLAVANLLFLF